MFHPIDTSDRLANVVVSSIATLIVALLGLILWMTSTNDPGMPAAAGQPPDETGVVDDAAVQDPNRVPANDSAGTAPDATVSDGSETDGAAAGSSGDTATGAGTDQLDTVEPPDRAVDGDAPTVADAGDGDGAAGAGDVDGDAGVDDDAAGTAGTGAPRDALPNPGRGSGLFSRDDPERMPAITVGSSPRDEMTVTADFDGDGQDERVWSAIVRDQVITRLERVVDGRWEPGRDHRAAPADRLIGLRARDLTGDGLPEVYTKQWVATEGESVTLWSVENDELVRMPVRGGCWANNNTVGIIGARVQVPAEGPASVVAICKDKPRPTQQWASALYRWQQGAWTFDQLLGKYQ